MAAWTIKRRRDGDVKDGAVDGEVDRLIRVGPIIRFQLLLCELKATGCTLRRDNRKQSADCGKEEGHGKDICGLCRLPQAKFG